MSPNPAKAGQLLQREKDNQDRKEQKEQGDPAD